MSLLKQFKMAAPLRLTSLEELNSACREITELMKLENNILMTPGLESTNELVASHYAHIRDKYKTAYSLEAKPPKEELPFEVPKLAEGELGGRIKKLKTAISDFFRNVFGTYAVTIDDAKKTLERLKNLNEDQIKAFEEAIVKHETTMTYKDKVVDIDEAMTIIEKASDKLMKELEKGKKQYMGINLSRISNADDALDETFKGVKLSAGNYSVFDLFEVRIDDDPTNLNYGSQYFENTTMEEVKYTYKEAVESLEKVIKDAKPLLATSGKRDGVYKPCHFIDEWISQLLRDYSPRSQQERVYFNKLYCKLILVLNIWAYLCRRPVSSLYWLEVIIHQAIQGRS